MTGSILPAFGMGTAAIGNLYRAVDDATADATVAAAIATGLRYFDTAPHYGFGLAERRLGAALARHDPDRRCGVSTKVGRLLRATDATGERHGFVGGDPYEPVFDYSADGIRRSFDASRARLGAARIDLLLAHDLGRLTHGVADDAHRRAFLDGGHAAMVALRDAGQVGAIGIGVNEVAVCHDLLDRVALDVILLAGRYTLLDRSAAELLDRCHALGVRVIVGGPYNSGILARDPATGDPATLHYDYAPASPAQIARTRVLARICHGFDVALPAAALRFPLTHPAVACVIAGLASPQEVDDMQDRIDAPIPDPLWPALAAAEEAPDAPAVAEAAPATDDASPRLILLHPDDNVLICVAPIAAGDILPVGGGTVPAREGITLGHKIARVALAAGDKVVKYGAPIGSMTADAGPGQWVHLHNMKSDYIASHTRSAVAEGRA